MGLHLLFSMSTAHKKYLRWKPLNFENVFLLSYMCQSYEDILFH